MNSLGAPGMSDDCRILVLGYSWFGPYTHNPAEEAALRLDGEEVYGCNVTGLPLPVAASRVLNDVPALLDEYSPAVAVGLGLDPRASMARLEAAAVNLMHFEAPDVDGVKKRVEPIEPRGPPVVAASLPLERAYRRCREERGLPIRIGLGIGTYLCNTLGYLIMRWASRRGRLGGFIHVPPHTQLAMRLGLTNYRSLGEIVETVRCIIEVSVEHFMHP